MRGWFWINLLFLMSISCIPFVTAVLAQHGQTSATVLYAATVGVSSLLAGWLWQHVGSSQGLAPALPDNTRRVTVLASIATAGVFALSILFAFFSPTAAKLVWLAIIPIALTRRYRLAHA